MEIVETRDSDLERRFAVTIPASEVEARIERRLEELAASLRLPGFRPGKVPLGVARERYGAGVSDEITRSLVRESAQQLLKDLGVQLALPPAFEVARRGTGEDLRYTLKIEVLPAVPPIDPEALELERPVVDDPGDIPEDRVRELTRAWMKRQLLDRLAEACQFPLSSAMVQRELATIERAVAAELQRETAPAPDAETLRALTERRVRLGLLLADIGRRHQIEGTGAALEDQVVDFLLQRARLTDRRIGLRDLVASVED